MIRELMEYLRMAENLFYRSNTYLGTPIYNTVLHSLVEAEEVSDFPRILFIVVTISLAVGTNYLWLTCRVTWRLKYSKI